MVDTNNVYCIECFNKDEKMYKDTVSTTNLAQHLRDCHSILYSFDASFHAVKIIVLVFLFIGLTINFQTKFRNFPI